MRNRENEKKSSAFEFFLRLQSSPYYRHLARVIVSGVEGKTAFLARNPNLKKFKNRATHSKPNIKILQNRDKRDRRASG